MRTRHKQIAIVSASAMTAGLAHGAIIYTYTNPSQSYNNCTPNGTQLFIDLNQDGIVDFNCNYNNGNSNKPFIDDKIGLSQPNYFPFVLSDQTDGGTNNWSQGLPVTTYGTLIDSSYESQQSTGYFYQDSNGNHVGGWNVEGTTFEGYVGLDLQDANSGNNYYGWAHFVYNSKTPYEGNTGKLTLVDYAMETTPNTGILAGQTAEVGTGPAIIAGPSSQSGAIQGSVQFSVVGTGNPAPTYQWKAGVVGSGIYTNLVDGGNILGATSNVLTVSSLSLSDTADYIVVLSNNVSTVASAPATLTVAPIAITSLTPSPAKIFTGGKLSLNVNYSSSAAISSFQWLKDGVAMNNGGNISGATSSNLVISTASPSDSANYSIAMANTYGSVTSVVDSVTVQTPTIPYDEAVTALTPAAYYQFNELTDPASGNAIAFDSFDGHNGTYGYQTANGNPTNQAIAGPLPSLLFDGFSTTNTALAITNTVAWSPAYVTAAPLNADANSPTANATFTAWIYPTVSQQAYASLISYRSPVANTASGIGYAGHAGANNTLGFHWNDGLSTWTYDSGLVVPIGQWSFVSMVINPTNAFFYVMNANGISVTNWVASNGYTNTIANAPAPLNTPCQIGGDAASPNFIGKIDDVAIFNQSLGYEQLTNLYNVAVTGVYTPPPPVVVLSLQKSGADLILTWTPAIGTLLEAPSVNGPWTTNSATSPYLITPTQSQMFYRVVN